MLHIESTDKIYFTRLYDQFKTLKGNRAINQKKIAKIIKDIESGFNMLPFCPIVVDNEMNVIDGQHRLQVSIKLQENVYYVICKPTTLPQVAKLNSRTERWKTEDFINCYIEQGVKDYETLKDFLNLYKLPKFVTLSLLQENLVTSNTTIINEAFENGQFKANYTEEATDFAKFIYKFKFYKKFTAAHFISALYQLRRANKCNLDELIEIAQKYNSPLDGCSGPKDYKLALEQIYNYKKSIRRIIF